MLFRSARAIEMVALFLLTCACAAPLAPPPDAAAQVDARTSPVDAGPPVACEDALVVHASLRCEILGPPLLSPRDAWVTRAGELVVTEFGAGRLLRLEGARWVTIADGLNGPIGVREASDGRLIVGEEHAHTVALIDPVTGERSLIAGDLRAVTYIALDARGALYVSRFDEIGGDVLRIDLATRAVASYATGLQVPEGLFVDDAGALFVAEWQRPSAILRFDRAGTAADATTVATGFDQIYGLHPDGAGGFLVGDHAGRIVRIDAGGAAEVLLDGIGRPGGLARDASGAIIVVEFVGFGAQGRVLRLAPR